MQNDFLNGKTVEMSPEQESYSRKEMARKRRNRNFRKKRYCGVVESFDMDTFTGKIRSVLGDETFDFLRADFRGTRLPREGQKVFFKTKKTKEGKRVAVRIDPRQIFHPKKKKSSRGGSRRYHEELMN